MKLSSKDLAIAPYEMAIAINIQFSDDGVRCGYLFVERNCPEIITLNDVRVTLPPEAVMQRNPIVLTEIILEIPYD